MTLLALLLAQGLWGFTAPQSTPQLVADQASTLNVTLELAPDVGLLVNRLNPPDVSLTSPWEASPLPTVVSGEPWADQPEVYFSQVDPVQWTLKVPAGTLPGRYEAVVNAKLGLCKKADGFCFVRDVTQTFNLTVRSPDNAEVERQQSVDVTLKFHAPRF